MTNKPGWKRKRYAEDPEFRQRQLEAGKAFWKAHCAAINADRRLRWATDPEYRERCRTANRACALKQRYGITLPEYNALLAKQKGRCAICLKKPKHRLQVDHCHRRKIARGLLCGPCNRGPGIYEDDPRRLRRAAAYASRALKPKPRAPTKPARKKRR